VNSTEVLETVTRIKICGITNLEDARAAVDYGADALGFIFVPESPRFVGAAQRMAPLSDNLPPFVARVGVCLEPSQIPVAVAARLTAIQFYSDEWPVGGGEGTDLIQAFRIEDEHSLDVIARMLKSGERSVSALLLDTYHKEKLGGSGEAFNWEIALEARARFELPIILAGGLTADNVEEAIVKVRPFAVDVSSGVEAEPGRKDHGKLKAFLQAVRRADALLGNR
jgi:phosphoribosylanthranilate isomerase